MLRDAINTIDFTDEQTVKSYDIAHFKLYTNPLPPTCLIKNPEGWDTFEEGIRFHYSFNTA